MDEEMTSDTSAAAASRSRARRSMLEIPSLDTLLLENSVEPKRKSRVPRPLRKQIETPPAKLHQGL